MDQLTELIRELADLNQQIWALPDDAFAEKHELSQKRDLLRERTAEHAVYADKGRSTVDLLSELSALRFQLDQIEGQKIDLVTKAGGGATGASNMTNLGGVSLNAQIMEAFRSRPNTVPHWCHQGRPHRPRRGHTSRKLIHAATQP